MMMQLCKLLHSVFACHIEYGTIIPNSLPSFSSSTTISVFIHRCQRQQCTVNKIIHFYVGKTNKQTKHTYCARVLVDETQIVQHLTRLYTVLQ